MDTFFANTEPMAPPPGAIELPQANQFVTFSADYKVYGVDVMAVRKIRSWSPTTELPDGPFGACGVLDTPNAASFVIWRIPCLRSKSAWYSSWGKLGFSP